MPYRDVDSVVRHTLKCHGAPTTSQLVTPSLGPTRPELHCWIFLREISLEVQGIKKKSLSDSSYQLSARLKVGGGHKVELVLTTEFSDQMVNFLSHL